MLAHTKVFSLTIAALLILTLATGAPFGYAAGDLVEPQGRGWQEELVTVLKEIAWATGS